MSVLSYNGVILPYTTTEHFDMEGVADPSNTNWMLLKFRISVDCLLTPDYISLLVPDMATNPTLGTGPASILAVVRNRLMQRRGVGAPNTASPPGPLSFKVNGVEIIPQKQTGGSPIKGNVDSANGPIPQSCSIVSVGAGCFLLSYIIHASYWESLSSNLTSSSTPSANIVGNPVISNRWIEKVVIDNENRSILSRDGKFIIRSDNTSGFSADRLRNGMAILALRPNFLRISREYQVSEDGLTLTYKIMDKEQWRMPLPPSYTSKGHLAFSSGKGGGNIQWEVSSETTADNGTSQAELGKATVAFALNQLLSALATGLTPEQRSKRRLIPVSINLTFNLFENRVSYRAKFLYPYPPTMSVTSVGYDTGTPFNYVGMASDPQGLFGGTPDVWWNQPPGYSAKTGGAYPPRGTANILLHAAGYWDPAIVNMAVNSNGYVVFNQDSNGGPPIPGEGALFPTGRGHGPGPDSF